MILMFLASTAAFAENTTLPDGTVFQSWEVEPAYTRTYHVAQKAPNASDDNPGTEEQPWFTIGKAAATLQPGERVLVHKGVYREWVKPARGGEEPDRMIAYEAAPGEEVVIKGSDLWTPQWERTRDFFIPNAPPTYCARLTGDLFEGANVFCLQNFPIQPDAQTWRTFPGFELRRGQLFLDGQPLTQVNDYPILVQTENAFWVEENGMTVHVRLAGDKSPEGQTFEITTREQVFAPTARALNYLRVSGFKVFHAGNGIPIPPPQRGALSATAGHHWIIEDCEVGYANTIGVDLGGQWWTYRGSDRQGWHIVRRNHVHHCGVAGICGWHNRPNQSLLVEDNLITDNGRLPITHHYETGGIKIHCTVNSLFRRNVFLRNRNSASLWLDGEITNTRITQNLFHDTQDSPFGAIFLEINQGPNLIDNNVILNSHTHGLYEHDAARIVVLQNLIAHGSGSAVHFNLGDPNRKFNDAHPENDHRIFGNILGGFDRYVWIPNATSQSDCNVLAGLNPGAAEPFVLQGQPALDLTGWRALGRDARSVEIPLEISFDEEALELRVHAPAGTRLPDFEPLAEILPSIPPLSELFPQGRTPPVDVELNSRFASMAELLRCDLLGQERDPNHLQVGPLVRLPLDGTPVRVDPRGGIRPSRKE
jgi:hypothetical protein